MAPAPLSDGPGQILRPEHMPLGSVISPDASITAIRALTQAEYDALDPKDPATLYVVEGA